MGYMGHLIEIFVAVQSTSSASDEFRALIESSLLPNNAGDGEPASEPCTEAWQCILQSVDEEVKTQTRLLADVDPSERQDYGRDGMSGFPSTYPDNENDTEDYDYQYSSSMQ